MFHSKFFLFPFVLTLIFSFTSTSFAQDAETPKLVMKRHWAKSLGFSYVSWTEFVDLSTATSTDQAFANFYGNALSYEKASFNRGHWGNAIEGSLMYGQAGAGGSQTQIQYQSSSQKWWGAQANYRWAYRLNHQVVLSMGPMALYRQITWSDQDTVTVKSGADLNLGWVGDLRLQLGRNWQLRQSIGTLAFKASTIWNLGLNYIF